MFKKTIPTFAGAIAQFHAVIEQLNQVIDNNSGKAISNDVQIEDLQKENAALLQENEKAIVARNKLRELIGE